LEEIRPNTYQPRRHFDEDALEPLAASIKELGVLQPLLVRALPGGGYELVAGERRLRASKLAGLDTVPVILRDGSASALALEEALVENLHRRDLNPIDEAAAYQQLIDDFSMTHDQVAKRVGKARTTISNLLRILNLPPKVQSLLIEEKLSEGHARALLGTSDAAFQAQLAARAVKEGLSVRAVEESVRLRNELTDPGVGRRSARRPSVAAPAALEWEDRLTSRLNTTVSVTVGQKRGKIVIDFADLADLDRVAAVITGVVAEGSSS